MCGFNFEVFSQSAGLVSGLCHVPQWLLCVSASAPENFVTLQKHQHMLREFLGNKLAFWFKFGGLLCEEREAPHHFSMIFAKSILRDPS